MDDSSGPLWALIFFVLFIIINGVLYGFGSAVQKVSESEIEKKAKEEGDRLSWQAVVSGMQSANLRKIYVDVLGRVIDPKRPMTQNETDGQDN